MSRNEKLKPIGIKKLDKATYSDGQLILVLQVCYNYEFYEQAGGWVLWYCQLYPEQTPTLFLLRREQVDRLFDSKGVLLSEINVRKSDG
jgi:hypothetical protein